VTSEVREREKERERKEHDKRGEVGNAVPDSERTQRDAAKLGRGRKDGGHANYGSLLSVPTAVMMIITEVFIPIIVFAS
jgi:hypothetical protein